MSPDRHQAGFTVLEALVALAILAMVTAGVLSVVATGRLAQDRSRADLVVALEAKTLLDRVGLDIPLTPGSLSGTFSEGRAWQVEIRSFSDDDEPGTRRERALYEVRVRVARGEGTEPSFELHSLRRGPP